MSRFALTALSWTIIALSATPTSPSVFDGLVQSQIVFIAQIMFDCKYKQKTTKLMKQFWNTSPDTIQRSLDLILKGASPSPWVLPMLNLIASYCHGNTSLQTAWTDRKVNMRIIIMK